MPMLSIIIPFKNEFENLDELFRRLQSTLTGISEMEFEIVLVDDGSDDGGEVKAITFVRQTSNAIYLRLVKNKGSHVAATVGLNHCMGDCAIVMAADLQDPPSLIPRMLAEWQAGKPVVWAERAARPGESRQTRILSSAFNRLIIALGVPNVSASGADVLLLSREAIDAYNQLRERNTSILALVAWLGFPQSVIQYEKAARVHGRSKWTFWKKIKLVIDTVVGFSYLPIRFISLIGVIVSILGFLYGTHVVFNAINGHPAEGWSSTIVVVLILGGTQLLILGVLGEYVWRALDETRARPRYVIQKKVTSPGVEQLNLRFDSYGNLIFGHRSNS
jgi:glycosyltransferase involved in cell wall biosynthesis